MTITEFLTARLDEDEAAERLCADTQHDWIARTTAYGTEPVGMSGKRVLAEVEAKRRIVADHRTEVVASIDPATRYQEFDVCVRCRIGERQVVAPCTTLRLLALPYADHPDYDEAWRV